MELWFRRAMEADPDNVKECDAKMEYLMPKWHGSVEDVIEFADQCLRTKNYQGRIPVSAAASMEVLYGCDRSAFRNTMGHPMLWNRIRAGYEASLEFEPDNYAMRTLYARACYFAGQKEYAHAQFVKLGKNVVSKYFKDRANLEEIKMFMRNRPIEK